MTWSVYDKEVKNYLTGGRGVEEALRRGRGVLMVSRKGGRVDLLVEAASQHGVAVRRVDEIELDRLCGKGEHRGFALEVLPDRRKPGAANLEQFLGEAGENALVAVLDGVTDPRNLGAVLRAADQFAVDAVVVPRRRSAGGNDAVSRASAGAVEWVRLVEVANTTRAIETLRKADFWCWGADMTGSPAHETDLTGRVALVMGREGEGLHRLVRESCDGLVRIPTGGRIDSLNIATAAGILMYEVRRQQGFPGMGG